MLFEIDGFDLSSDEKATILHQATTMAEENGEKLEKIKVWLDQEGYLCFQPFFSRNIKRVRRITGYFSEIKNFNEAKKAELHDRVAHA